MEGAYLRYLSDDPRAAQLKQQAVSQVCFNYLGNNDSTSGSYFTLSAQQQCFVSRTEHLLKVDAGILEGCLKLDFNYSKLDFSADVIEVLADKYVLYLEKLIEHCCRQKKSAFTASDFAVDTSQQVLDMLTSQESESETDEIEEF